MLPVNISSLRGNPMRPERPGPEKPEPIARPERPVSGVAPGPGARMALPPTFRRGGRVKRTGWAKVHKGEHVLTKGAAEAMGAGKSRKKARGARKKK